ncbi:uncharacterized protein RAG0_04731 [Rhynchosporium agropyri]|uniref:Uncharacterized protein n=1 Tax=Rhynchosporium agropyri TaxID=914238 RepID=A0A1E1KA13_9HELO|nr:uncharacterized protein RAG0_04731 [Rhynchosporium agropyri]
MAAPQTSGYLRTNDPTEPRSDAAVPFRDIIPSPDHPRIAGIHNHDASKLVYDYAEDEGAPTEEIIEKVDELMVELSEVDKKAVHCGEVTDDDFRIWSNPELYMNPGGLRLDECSADVQRAIHSILKASTFSQGYEKILGCCRTNGFLGHLVNGRKVLNEHSYHFRLFGTPSLTSPWGYTFFGHHLCLNVVFLGKRMVIGPIFMGAEPDRIDEGPHAGLRLFRAEELESLKLMQSLPKELQDKATLSKGMDGKSLPADKWNPFDERHLGGARQDNRIVPYEGCPVSAFPADKQESIIKLFKNFNEYYPQSVLAHRLSLFKKYLNETYFAWIGEFGDEDPYYYRIHSPVAFMELDFHCGIFLTNTTPARCHIHTVNRLPNRGDYGRALIGA